MRSLPNGGTFYFRNSVRRLYEQEEVDAREFHVNQKRGASLYVASEHLYQALEEGVPLNVHEAETIRCCLEELHAKEVETSRARSDPNLIALAPCPPNLCNNRSVVAIHSFAHIYLLPLGNDLFVSAALPNS